MKLQIISPDGMLLDKDVDSVTVPGGAGSFTVLRGHAPILSTLTGGPVAYRSGGVTGTMEVGRGIVRVQDDVIKIYV